MLYGTSDVPRASRWNLESGTIGGDGGESVKSFGAEWIEGGVKSGRCCRGCLLSECSIDACASASQVLVFSILLCIRSVLKEWPGPEMGLCEGSWEGRRNHVEAL